MTYKTDPMIFVFGSNLRGVHGAGAAAHATQNLGYPWGVAFGLHGKAFGIPTKDRNIQTMGLAKIKGFVNEFLTQAANDHKLYQFQVTRIGCGLAGLKDSDIAPMFENAPENCYFDSVWEQFFIQPKQYWGTF